MAEAFNGGVVMISHDFRLLQQVADEIWVVDRGLKVWDRDIRSYKASLKSMHVYNDVRSYTEIPNIVADTICTVHGTTFYSTVNNMSVHKTSYYTTEIV